MVVCVTGGGKPAYTSPGDIGRSSNASRDQTSLSATSSCDQHAPPTESKLITYACSAVHGFFRSIALSVQSSLQDALRSEHKISHLAPICHALPPISHAPHTTAPVILSTPFNHSLSSPSLPHPSLPPSPSLPFLPSLSSLPPSVLPSLSPDCSHCGSIMATILMYTTQ